VENKLETKVEEKFEQAERSYQRAVMEHEEELAFAQSIPESLQEIDWWILHRNHADNADWYMETNIVDNEKGAELRRQLGLLGAVNFREVYKGHSEAWKCHCYLRIGEETVLVCIDGGATPPACRIEATTEMQEIITYKAICENTGEEI